MLRLVVVPGMDGSGSMLGPFAASMGTDFDVACVVYPPDVPLDYAGLEQHVLRQLPASGDFILLGESFGGPLAVMLAARRPRGLRGLVLCASFARYPVAGLRALAPLAPFVPDLRIPDPVLSWFAFGRWSTPALCASLQESIAKNAIAAMRSRLDAVLRVDASEALLQVEVPVLYLKATHDRIVPPGASRHLQRILPRIRREEVTGPHFLLQAVPDDCARAIRHFAEA